MKSKTELSSNKRLAFSLIELSLVILVIGILIAGVMAGSAMITKMKVATAANQTKASAVPSIKNLIFWIETSSSGSVVGSNAAYSAPFDGDTVSKWNDINPQSSFKINPVPLAGGESPTYKENGINGLPSVLFDAVDDRLVSSGISVTRNNSIFAVFNSTFLPSASRDIVAITTNSGGHGIMLELNYGVRSLYRNPMGGSGGNDFTSVSISHSKDYIISSVRNYDTLSQKVWLNHTSLIDQPVTLGDLDNPVQSITVGNLHSGSGGTVRPLNGMISEIIIYNRALTQSEVNDVEAYLSKKYNITLN
ncbi:MAG: hypothetical protein KGQ36_06040 [Rickettsiales bacterium]|nr:hypothetical protein [Rickettsiales bacterium]